MHKRANRITYSASDIVAFLGCEHRTTLDLLDLETPLQRAPADEQIELIQEKGFAHEAGYLDSMRTPGIRLVELTSQGSFAKNAAATREAMLSGADVVFQAALADGDFMGYADFLRRVETPSALGAWSYEVADTKLALRAKPKFMIQLAHYSALLAVIQDVHPQQMHLILGDRTERSFRVADYQHYYLRLRRRFEAFLHAPAATNPEKSDACGLCDWRDRCRDEWEANDHLNRVANISKVQIQRLRQNGVHTLTELASLPAESSIARMQADTLARLRAQAALQLKKQQTGQDQLELLPRNPTTAEGFDRLPAPDPGDIFFDMEGDPLHDGGLEYLFGVHLTKDGEWHFRDFWAHDRRQEKQAFADFVDFVTDHLLRHPYAHIYHYAHYEPTAMKRLMSLHGIREAEIDQLLRENKFVDLYPIVRQSIRVSEPRYSIKNLETFYMEKRGGDVTNAGASIVFYEKWRATHDDTLLAKIREYNADDCRSTQLLRDWLLTLKPTAVAAAGPVPGAPPATQKSDKTKDYELRLAAYQDRLLAGVPDDPARHDAEQKLRALLAQLLDFHRRTAKPVWWALFARRDATEEELIDDTECIAALQQISVSPPANGKRTSVVTYRYPEQEFKLREGDECIRTDTTAALGRLGVVDEIERTVQISIGVKKEIPQSVSICSGGPINTDVIREALFRLADGYLTSPDRYTAALRFLQRSAPIIAGRKSGEPIISEASDALPQIIEAVTGMDRSTLFIQGPPGAGKTYTGSHVIAQLIARGYRVGVTSNSHKAVHNLLHGVEARAQAMGLQFKGEYKASGQTRGSEFIGTQITSRENADDVASALDDPSVLLFAGTAWLFCRPKFDQALDYLFVDEAGQVAVANLVAMGLSVKNIVLLGDQMQLGQPIQGIHPGDSGLSALDFLLEGRATIAPDRGVFLATTWRMHPDVCRFISEAVYEGRLIPEPQNANQGLILGSSARPELRETGLVFVPAIHDGCSQRSEEEAALVREIYDSLLQQRYRNRDGKESALGTENILVVAPYNMQVNLLRSVLPDGARVGTVDKFQGQEAEVVIVSMATSNADSMPRNIEFLYSKNRLNVAISRARCLAIVVASPALAEISCTTVEQMSLVNLLCGAISA